MRTHCLSLATLAALAALVPALQAQVTIPESVALPVSAVDKTKPGFKVRVVQATASLGELANTLVRTESQLAGLLAKPDGSLYENVADLSSFNPDGTYDEPGFIAYGGSFFPGIPGTESTVNNISLEAITYAELQPGTYSMVVNSDDGFRVTTGDVRDRTKEIVLGFFDGGRGAGDTVFNFTVSKAGVYPFRLIYEQGGGGYSVDWYTADPADPSQRIHLNEDGGIKSYRALAANVPVPPAIIASVPSPGAVGAAPSTGLTVLLKDGSAAVPTASVKLSRNGTDVTSSAQITKQGSVITVSYKPTALPDPLSQESYVLTYDDPTESSGKREATIQYTLAAYANYNLPAPIWYQDFNSVAEGSLPAGWTTFSPIEPTGSEDLDNPKSDSYLVWAVISRDRVQAIGAAGGFDAARRLNTPEAYVNGVKVQSLIDGNFAYHESDVRSGSQYAELISPAVDLTGKSSVYLVYNSIYEQNQDNIAGTEYSIDDGKTWLPVVYMVDAADIVKKEDGSTDAEATLTAPQSDTAFYTDPNTGEEIGRTYGAFVKSDPTTWKDLAAYVSGRINDDANESKRIERYRLEKADGQSKVRLRFFQAGTGSWYYGVDNVGLYSIVVVDPPALTEQPASATRYAGTSVTFKFGATGTGVTFQWQKDGVNIPNATGATLTLANLKASDAGKYRAIATNPGGTLTSAEATLVVQTLPSDVSSLKNGLAAYLPFNGNLQDASGNNRNGTAVGTPTFDAGKVGSNAVKISNEAASSTHNFVTLGSNAEFTPGQSSDFTVAFWMKTERVSGDPAIIGTKNWGSGNNPGWLIGTQTDGRLEWNYRRVNADGLSRKDLDALGQGLAANEWHHVTVVFQINGNAVSYVDGAAVDSRTIAPGTGDLSDPALAFNIGQDGTGVYDSDWSGLLDEVAVWNRALTADEVGILHALGVIGTALDGSGGTVAPTLTFSVTGNQLKLDWTGAGFVLEENTDIANTAGWTAVGGVSGNSATVSTGTGNRFFRLKK